MTLPKIFGNVLFFPVDLIGTANLYKELRQARPEA